MYILTLYFNSIKDLLLLLLIKSISFGSFISCWRFERNPSLEQITETVKWGDKYTSFALSNLSEKRYTYVDDDSGKLRHGPKFLRDPQQWFMQIRSVYCLPPVLGNPAFITKIPRKLFLKRPPCATAETEGVNLVVIDTLVSLKLPTSERAETRARKAADHRAVRTRL